MIISFFVPGTAKPGGSKTGFFNKKLGRVMIVDANKGTKPWMNTVRSYGLEAYKGELITGPVVLNITFKMLRIKGHYGTGSKASVLKAKAPVYMQTRPDLTKLTRATEDALKGVIWRDDSQVVIQHTQKVYVERDPGAEIVISDELPACVQPTEELEGLFDVQETPSLAGGPE